MNCDRCGTPLNGKLDTFGPVGGELCRTCWFDSERELFNDGFWTGGDPRHVEPDPEGCEESQIALWKLDCARWNEGHAMARRVAAHPYGIGVTTVTTGRP